MRGSSLKRGAVIWLISVLLVGCQTLDTSQPADWVMQGRLLIRTPDQAERMNIAWRQLDEDTEILLTGALGASIARLSSDPSGYRLERPGSAPLFANSLNELVYAAIGINLPVSAAIGVLSGETQSIEFEDWRLNVADFDDQGRPMIVNIVNPSASIKLQVQSWR